MIEKLKCYFSSQWKEIFAFAVLKCQEQAVFKQMDFLYSNSYLSVLLGGLPFLPSQITLFLKNIGQQWESISNYMKSDIPDTGIIMFDGRRLISRSTSLEYARVGYDSKQRFLPQVNLLYLFGVGYGKRLPWHNTCCARKHRDTLNFMKGTDIILDLQVQNQIFSTDVPYFCVPVRVIHNPEKRDSNFST